MAQPAFEFLRERFGRAVATLGVFLETLETDRREIAVHGGIQNTRRWRLLLADLAQGLHQVLAAKRRLAGQRLEQHRAQPIHVRRGGDLLRLARRLLGRHVVRAAHHCERLREVGLFFHQLGEAEIREHRLALRIQQDVPRLDVAMQNPALMRVVNGARDLGHERRSGARGRVIRN